MNTMELIVFVLYTLTKYIANTHICTNKYMVVVLLSYTMRSYTSTFRVGTALSTICRHSVR